MDVLPDELFVRGDLVSNLNGHGEISEVLDVQQS